MPAQPERLRAERHRRVEVQQHRVFPFQPRPEAHMLGHRGWPPQAGEMPLARPGRERPDRLRPFKPPVPHGRERLVPGTARIVGEADRELRRRAECRQLTKLSPAIPGQIIAGPAPGTRQRSVPQLQRDDTPDASDQLGHPARRPQPSVPCPRRAADQCLIYLRQPVAGPSPGCLATSDPVRRSPGCLTSSETASPSMRQDTSPVSRRGG